MNLSDAKFDTAGLLPVIAQDVTSRAVLMLAYADREALELTEKTGYAHFYSRSRRSLWMKGETSGNKLEVKSIRLDCDGDAVLYECRATGPTCHTGSPTCFFRTLVEGEGEDVSGLLGELQSVLLGRMKSADPGSYTAKLLTGDAAAIRRKIQEESFETILASEKDDKKNLREEVADLWFHSILLLLRHGLRIEDVLSELASRRGKRRE